MLLKQPAAGGEFRLTKLFSFIRIFSITSYEWKHFVRDIAVQAFWDRDNCFDTGYFKFQCMRTPNGSMFSFCFSIPKMQNYVNQFAGFSLPIGSVQEKNCLGPPKYAFSGSETKIYVQQTQSAYIKVNNSMQKVSGEMFLLCGTQRWRKNTPWAAKVLADVL